MGSMGKAKSTAKTAYKPSTAAATAKTRRLRTAKQELFLAKISQGWSVSKAAAAAGIDDSTPYVWVKDAKFKEKYHAAQERGTQRIEDEALRRAVEGTERFVFHKGRIVTDEDGNKIIEREYSDRLLELLLKSRRPTVYRDNVRVETQHSGTMAVDLTTPTAAEKAFDGEGE